LFSSAFSGSEEDLTATVAVSPAQVMTGEIFVAAPPARVFQALTDPAQIPRWWGAKELYPITEWKADHRVGGKRSSEGVGADGTTFRMSGKSRGAKSLNCKGGADTPVRCF
jgi:uncharacterized protein YndB with AHSA1/START domain